MELTNKQERFAQAVARGLTYSDAYREAYNTGRMQMATINKRASGLAKREHVAARIEELRGEIRGIMTLDVATVKDAIVEQEMAILTASLGDVFQLDHSEDGEVVAKARDKEALKTFDWRAVQEVRYDSKGRLIMKLYDKSKAADTLRSIYGIEPEQTEDTSVQITITGADKYVG